MLAVTINRIGSGITLLEIGWRTEVFCGKELQQPENNRVSLPGKIRSPSSPGSPLIMVMVVTVAVAMTEGDEGC